MLVARRKWVRRLAGEPNPTRDGADVRSEVLDGCGHHLSEERPRQIAALLGEFFSD